MEGETGNKQGSKHVTIQFKLEEVLRWERGADSGKVVQEGFLEELTFKSKAEGCEGAATQRSKVF